MRARNYNLSHEGGGEVVLGMRWSIVFWLHLSRGALLRPAYFCFAQ